MALGKRDLIYRGSAKMSRGFRKEGTHLHAFSCSGQEVRIFLCSGQQVRDLFVITPEERQALSPNGSFSTEAPEMAKMTDFLIKKVSKAWRTTFSRNLGGAGRGGGKTRHWPYQPTFFGAVNKRRNTKRSEQRLGLVPPLLPATPTDPQKSRTVWLEDTFSRTVWVNDPGVNHDIVTKQPVNQPAWGNWDQKVRDHILGKAAKMLKNEPSDATFVHLCSQRPNMLKISLLVLFLWISGARGQKSGLFWMPSGGGCSNSNNTWESLPIQTVREKVPLSQTVHEKVL